MRGLGLLLVAASVWFAGGSAVRAAADALVTIEGKLTYRGNRVPDGKIAFHFEDGQFVGARVKNGKYRVDRVPDRPAKVTVESKSLRLPAKYASADTSPLTLEVKPGHGPTDFELTD